MVQKKLSHIVIALMVVMGFASCNTDDDSVFIENTIKLSMNPYQLQGTTTFDGFKASSSNPSGSILDAYYAISGLSVNVNHIPKDEKLTKVTLYADTETFPFRKDGNIKITASMKDPQFGQVTGGTEKYTRHISTIVAKPIAENNQIVQILLFPVTLENVKLYIIATTQLKDNTTRAYKVDLKVSGTVVFSPGLLNSCSANIEEAKIKETRFTEIENVGLNNGYGIELYGKIFSPVNCGFDKAHPYGLLYQFGRQDGQPYDNEGTAPIIKSEVLDFSAGTPTINPNTFYIDPKHDGETENWRTPVIYSWQSTPFNASLWEVLGTTESELLMLSGYRPVAISSVGTPDNIAGYWAGYDADKATADNPRGCLFIPAAGFRNEFGLAYERNEVAALWVNKVDESSKRPSMTIIRESSHIKYPFCSMGASVRCVLK